MKSFHIFALLLCFIYLVYAIPVPGHGDAKGKGKAKDTSPPTSPHASRPGTPTPEHDPTVPLPGRSGHHVDPHTGVVTTFYGDDHLPGHMGHLQRNQAAHPNNRHPMPLNPQAEGHNRAAALANIPTAKPHHVTGVERVRDEKMPNFMHNPHHSSSTTVEYLPRPESNKEGGLLQGTRQHAEKLGDKGRVQLRPNPGWLPLHPGQRRGHEAPARLNSQTFRPGGAAPAPKAKSNTAKGHSEASASKIHAGYTPSVAGKELRHRPGKPAPPPPPPAKPKKDPHGPSNLQPGFRSAPGHVWHPPANGPHRDAPHHLAGAKQRHPPRPQNHDHYMQQQHKKAATSHHAAKPAAHKDPKHAANLAKFNALFPPTHHAAHAGSGRPRAHEAPARMTSRPDTHRSARPVAHGHAASSSHGGHHPPSRPRSPSPHSPKSHSSPNPAHKKHGKRG